MGSPGQRRSDNQSQPWCSDCERLRHLLQQPNANRHRRYKWNHILAGYHQQRHIYRYTFNNSVSDCHRNLLFQVTLCCRVLGNTRQRSSDHNNPCSPEHDRNNTNLCWFFPDMDQHHHRRHLVKFGNFNCNCGIIKWHGHRRFGWNCRYFLFGIHWRLC